MSDLLLLLSNFRSHKVPVPRRRDRGQVVIHCGEKLKCYVSGVQEEDQGQDEPRKHSRIKEAEK